MKMILTMTLGYLISFEANAMVYHLIRASDYAGQVKEGYLYEPSLETEGYIHNATISQLVAAANRHYKEVNDTLVLVLDERLLEHQLRYDYVERHKQNFPHIYGPINLSAIVHIYVMAKSSDGTYILPTELQICE